MSSITPLNYFFPRFSSNTVLMEIATTFINCIFKRLLPPSTIFQFGYHCKISFHYCLQTIIITFLKNNFTIKRCFEITLSLGRNIFALSEVGQSTNIMRYDATVINKNV